MGYTIGVSQNQNCNPTWNNCPTSLKNTFRTPIDIPKPTTKNNMTSTTGMKEKTTIPGKFPVNIRNEKNSNMKIVKLINASTIMTTTRHSLGKLIFLMTSA